jgi:CDGSH-type Zn-finger protein
VPPKISGPEVVTLKPGEAKYMCSCGQSKKFPFCDGSHRAYNEANGTSFSSNPVKNETEEDKTYYFCACSHSKNRFVQSACDVPRWNLLWSIT